MPCFIHFRNGRCQATSRSVIMCGLDRIGTGARRNPSAVKTRTALIPHMKSFRFPHIMCEGTAWLNFPSHVRPSKCGSLSAKALLSCDLSHLRLTLPSECSYKPWFLISWRLPMGSSHWRIRTMYKESTPGSHLLQGRLLWKYWRASFLDAQLSLLQELSVSMRDQRASVSSSTADRGVNIADSTRISPMIPAEARFGWNSAAVSTLVWISYQAWWIREKTERCGCASRMSTKHNSMSSHVIRPKELDNTSDPVIHG